MTESNNGLDQMVTTFSRNAFGVGPNHNLGNTLNSITKNQSDITDGIHRIGKSCNDALKQVFGESIEEFQLNMEKCSAARTMFKLIAEVRRQLTEFILNRFTDMAIPTSEKVES